MTLLELMHLLRTKIKLIVILPIICALACYLGAAFLVTPSYSATATVVTNANFSLASGLASNAATEASMSGTEVKSTPTSSTSSVALKAEGPDAQACIRAANNAADSAKDKIGETTPDSVTEVTEADSAENEGHSPALYAVVGLLGGLFVAIVIVVAADTITPRVHDWSSVQEATELPYLGSFGGTRPQQQRLAVAVRLAGHENGAMTSSLCLVPAGETDGAVLVGKQLNATRAGEPLSIVAAPPLDEGAEAILDARKAEACVLVVEAERSTFSDLETVLRELKVADVKPVGFVYVDPAHVGHAQAARPSASAPKHE